MDGLLPQKPAPERSKQMLRALYQRLHDAADDSHTIRFSPYVFFGKTKCLENAWSWLGKAARSLSVVTLLT